MRNKPATDTFEGEYGNTYDVYYTHLYSTKGFDVMSKNQKRRHSCLKFGNWCWKNALEDPLMAIKFIVWKLKK